MKKTPIAWLQLIREKVRFAVALAGIAFAALLIFVQLGIQDALFEGCMLPEKAINADLVMINPQFQTFFSPSSFSRARLYQCMGFPGVSSVGAIYVGKGMFKNPNNKTSRGLIVYACDPLRLPFHIAGLQEQMPKMKLLNRVLFDSGSRPEYGPIKDIVAKDGAVFTEVNERHVEVTGTFLLGASFSSDGNLLCSESTFFNIFPERRPEQVDVGIISLQPDTSAEEVRSSIRSSLKDDVVVITPQEFAERERKYWINSTGIGYVFGLGVVVGIFVGVVVVYQVLYSDVCDHLSEYATLKAIGYSNGFLNSVVIQEAMIMAICGYIPAMILSLIVYRVSADATLLPICMTVPRACLVLILCLLMCGCSALIAMQKLRQADPAEIF